MFPVSVTRVTRAAFAALGALALSACGINSVPPADETAKAKWADVEAASQERANLLPNLQVVARARRLQFFLSQPMFVAEQFTGREGRYVPIKDTVRGCRMILDGEVDHIPEQMFYMAGPIEDVLQRYQEADLEE